MKKYKVGVLGATGVVGQRFVSLIEKHPWFELCVVAASAGSAGKTYEDAVSHRWTLPGNHNAATGKLIVRDVSNDIKSIAGDVDFVFSAVDMEKEQVYLLEEAYAKAECPVVSNNGSHRQTPDVPMIIPEVNPHHSEVIYSQRKRLGSKRGFIAVKSNCSIQSFVPVLHPIREAFGLVKVLACTYQSISGAGKTFETWPEMIDNVIPFIKGEEEKTENEPLKIWGKVDNGVIKSAVLPKITAQCLRVPTTEGHMAAVFMSLADKVDMDSLKALLCNYNGQPQLRGLPSAPKNVLRYFEEEDRPQTKLDRDLESGMSVSIGRLRHDTQYDYKFIGLSHNTIKGAAGGAVLLAELLCTQGFIVPGGS